MKINSIAWYAVVLAGVSHLALVEAAQAQTAQEQEALCKRYEPEITTLTEQLRDESEPEDRSELIAEFLKKAPEAQVCIANNNQIAAILSDVEPAAGDGDGDGGFEEGDGENPNQLNEPEGDGGEGEGDSDGSSDGNDGGPGGEGGDEHECGRDDTTY